MGTHTNRIYDLDKRTFIFAKNVREYVNKLPKKVTNAKIELIGESKDFTKMFATIMCIVDALIFINHSFKQMINKTQINLDKYHNIGYI